MINGITLVAEAGINANGSIDIARKLIDVAADNGCDYIKFQKRDINTCYTQEELDAPRESPWGKTNRAQKEGLEFGLDEYHAIDKHCRERGIGWFVSCWDKPSVDFIDNNFDVPFHKVASALLTDARFLERLVMTRKPVILSTGMATEEQIFRACDILGTSLDTILHCTSTYPTKPEEMNLSYIRTLNDSFDIIPRLARAIDMGLKNMSMTTMTFNDRSRPNIGFSNHYSGLSWVPAVVALGAKMLEFHITLDRTSYGSDQSASLEPEGVKKLVDYVRITTSMMGNGVKRVYDSEQPIIKKLRKTNTLG